MSHTLIEDMDDEGMDHFDACIGSTQAESLDVAATLLDELAADSPDEPMIPLGETYSLISATEGPSRHVSMANDPSPPEEDPEDQAMEVAEELVSELPKVVQESVEWIEARSRPPVPVAGPKASLLMPPPTAPAVPVAVPMEIVQLSSMAGAVSAAMGLLANSAPSAWSSKDQLAATVDQQMGMLQQIKALLSASSSSSVSEQAEEEGEDDGEDMTQPASMDLAYEQEDEDHEEQEQVMKAPEAPPAADAAPPGPSPRTPGRLFNSLQPAAIAAVQLDLLSYSASPSPAQTTAVSSRFKRKFASPTKGRVGVSVQDKSKDKDKFAFPEEQEHEEDEGGDQEEEEEEEVLNDTQEIIPSAPVPAEETDEAEFIPSSPEPSPVPVHKSGRKASKDIVPVLAMTAKKPSAASKPPTAPAPAPAATVSSASSVSSADSFDLPPSLLTSMPSTWAALWAVLELHGWSWMKGRGLVDFYYLRPGAKPARPCALGIDYFASQDEVEDFVRESLRKCKPPPPPSSRGSASKINGNTTAAASAYAAITAGTTSSTSSSQGVKAKPLARTATSTSSTTATSEHKHDIGSMQWKDLWKLLRAAGWTWEFGKGHLNHYYVPGYGSKSEKSAQQGVHKFTNEEEVRKFVKQQIRSGKQTWPEIIADQSSQSQSQSQGEDWMLVTHRRKRPVEEAIEASLAEQQVTKKVRPVKVVEELTQAQHATPPTKMHLTNRTPNIHSASKIKTDLLRGWQILLSGLADDKKEEIEKLIAQHGGAVISKYPDDLRKQVVLLSHPQDFRKTKYVQMIIHGVLGLHVQWLMDSIAAKALLPVQAYRLPAIYSALHSHYIFPTPGRKLLTGVKVVNLTGQKMWNDLLLAAGAILVAPEGVLAGLLALRMADCIEGKELPVDALVFDPITYANSADGRKNKKALSRQEVLVLQHCHQLYDEASNGQIANWPPLVASVDWLTHCIALNDFVNIHSLDIFTLPVDPEHRPVSYKADMDPSLEVASSSSSAAPVVSGERYCKYDFVFFAHDSGSGKDKLSMGKIVGFTRRNIDAAMLVRIRPLDVKKRRLDGMQVLVTTDEERMIPAKQLVKKLVIYEIQEYERLAYTAADEDIFPFSAEHWQAEWPVIKFNQVKSPQQAPQPSRPHPQASQDF